MPAPSYIPENIKQFWSENPTIYTKDDIFHLEPGGLTTVFLKTLALNSPDNPPIDEKYPIATSDGFYMITSDNYKICVQN